MEETDAALAGKARSGDRGALALLVRRYEHSVFGFVRSHLGRRADAEDVAQEVLLAACTHIEQLRAPESFAAWLFGIARTKIKAHIRRGSRRERADDLLDTRAGRVAEDEPALEDLLGGLPDEVRVVVLLRFRDGLDYREIAERLAMPIGTVGTVLFRAREHLRQRLSREGARP